MTAEEVQALRDTGIYAELFEHFDKLLETHSDALEDMRSDAGKLEIEFQDVQRELSEVRGQAKELGETVTHHLSEAFWALNDVRGEDGELVYPWLEQDFDAANEAAERLVRL